MLQRLGIDISAASLLEWSTYLLGEVWRVDALVRETIDDLLLARREQIQRLTSSVQSKVGGLVQTLRETTELDALVSLVRKTQRIVVKAATKPSGNKKKTSGGAASRSAVDMEQEDFENLLLCSLVSLLSILLLIRYYRHLVRMQRERARR